MLIIAVGNGAMFVAELFMNSESFNLTWLLMMHRDLVLQGEIWRLATFVFIPPSSALWLLTPLIIYMYFWMGRSIEGEWGRLKFTLYYLTGMATVIAGSFLFGRAATGADLNLSLFLAMATLFPETQIRIYFILPVKLKWLALLYAGMIVFSVISSRSLMPLMPVISYLIFFGPQLLRMVRRRGRNEKQAIEFKSELRRAKKEKGFLHQCAVCGATDTDRPDLEFRYCSLCAGYECYCQDHIRDHEHVSS
jgi:membrane associated rhomboid family serine protease